MISRRTFLKAAGAAAAPYLFSQPAWGRTAPVRPNIVLIIGDDISAGDHGVYGHPTIKTPHIDRLAANGLRLTNAYLTAASCSPTRCSIITGRYPHNTAAPELHMPLPAGQVMFPKRLQENGYYTAAVGKWHLGEHARQAFDQIRDSGPSGAEYWVETLRQRPREKPFFMWFASHDAHRQWDRAAEAEPPAPEQAVVPPYQVDSDSTRRDLASYMGEVQRLDGYVGAVVGELQKQGVLRNTLLIYMADNGRPFPRDKAWLYDAAIKTPFIVHWPDGLAGQGMVSPSLISAIDIAPTLLEAAGVQVPETVQGRSFLPLFQNPETTMRDYAFAEQNWHTQYIHLRAVRWRHYLYIRNQAPELRNLMMAHIDRQTPAWMDLWNSPALTAAQKNVMTAPRPEEELYDVTADPDQLKNLVDVPDCRTVLEHLRTMLNRWANETGDTVPDRQLRTPDRYDRHTGNPTGVPFNPPRRDWAGKAAKADKINRPGPIK